MNTQAKTIMVQGTTSDAGKTTLVAALCRILKNRGVAVVPFKPQNMALNSAVTIDGGEIGRAQALQAQAAGIEPHTDMNPILIKPTSDTRAQIIVQGRAITDMEAAVYHDYKTQAMSYVLDSYARLHPQVNFQWVGPNQIIPACDLIIIPGSKNTRADLDFLRAQGWDLQIQKHLRYGGKLIGICGGFQMLGEVIDDPLGVESEAGSTLGLGYFALHTQLQPHKILQQRSGFLWDKSSEVQGYEIHTGVSNGAALDRSVCYLHAPAGQDATALVPEGAISVDNLILGTYLHGLFDQPQALQLLLQWAGASAAQCVDINSLREVSLERLAAAVTVALEPKWLAQ